VSERGQGSLEYVAVVALVVAALAVGGAVRAGPAIADAVVRQFARALCIVGAGDCEQDRAPCVVASRRTEDDAHVNLLLVRIGGDQAILREERSDGSVAVTYLHDLSGGLDVGLGVDVRLSLGRSGIVLGGELRAAVLAHLGKGTTYLLPDGAAADRVVAALRDHLLGGGRLPSPAETYTQHGLSVTLDGSGGNGTIAGSVELTSEDLFGQRVDHRTGRRTAYVRRRNGVTGSVSLEGGSGVQGSASASEVYAVTVDRSGRPLDLAIVSGGAYDGSPSLPSVLQPVAGELGGPPGVARMYESEEHLDLTDPANLAAARDFLDQVRDAHPRLGRAVAVSRALHRRLDEAGTVQARTYATGSSSIGATAHLGAGVKVGGGYTHTTASARLLRAMLRSPTGVWTRRDDCVAA
jgi:hypothetical protein